jgi:hypothetical protein
MLLVVAKILGLAGPHASTELLPTQIPEVDDVFINNRLFQCVGRCTRLAGIPLSRDANAGIAARLRAQWEAQGPILWAQMALLLRAIPYSRRANFNVLLAGAVYADFRLAADALGGDAAPDAPAVHAEGAAPGFLPFQMPVPLGHLDQPKKLRMRYLTRQSALEQPLPALPLRLAPAAHCYIDVIAFGHLLHLASCVDRIESVVQMMAVSGRYARRSTPGVPEVRVRDPATGAAPALEIAAAGRPVRTLFDDFTDDGGAEVACTEWKRHGHGFARECLRLGASPFSPQSPQTRVWGLRAPKNMLCLLTSTLVGAEHEAVDVARVCIERLARDGTLARAFTAGDDGVPPLFNAVYRGLFALAQLYVDSGAPLFTAGPKGESLLAAAALIQPSLDRSWCTVVTNTRWDTTDMPFNPHLDTAFVSGAAPDVSPEDEAALLRAPEQELTATPADRYRLAHVRAYAATRWVLDHMERQGSADALAALNRQWTDYYSGTRVTPLHIAVRRGNERLVRLLVQRGARLVDYKPLALACARGMARAVEALLDSGLPDDAARRDSILNSAARDGPICAVFGACTSAHVASAQMLAAAGARVMSVPDLLPLILAQSRHSDRFAAAIRALRQAYAQQHA